MLKWKCKENFFHHIFSVQAGRLEGELTELYILCFYFLFYSGTWLCSLHFLLRMITANELHLCPSPVFLSSSHSSLRFLLTSLAQSGPAMIFGLKCFWLLAVSEQFCEVDEAALDGMKPGRNETNTGLSITVPSHWVDLSSRWVVPGLLSLVSY